ncbi:MAG: DMT family transporter [Hyphomicrobiales bacterium]|nr:DMT family transporter [Hyphomicrobiales bacterium]
MAAPRTGAGVALALICLCILGVMPVIANSRPQDFSALGFALFLSVWQTVFAVPLFVRELRSDEKGIFAVALNPQQKRRTLVIALATGAMFGLSTYLYVFGVEKAGTVSAAIAIQAYPLFAILWETIFLNRRKTLVELALTAALIAALYFLGTGGTWRIDGFSPWFFVALGVPFLWSIAHVIIKEELSRTPVTPAQITFFRVAISTVFLFGVMAAFDPSAMVSAIQRPDYQAFALVMGLAYYLELIVWFHAVRHIDVSLASSITTPWPALTMVLAAIFLGDRVAGYQVMAFVVVAASIYGLTIASLRKARTEPA